MIKNKAFNEFKPGILVYLCSVVRHTQYISGFDYTIFLYFADVTEKRFCIAWNIHLLRLLSILSIGDCC